jgi:hypothetical protein
MPEQCQLRHMQPAFFWTLEYLTPAESKAWITMGLTECGTEWIQPGAMAPLQELLPAGRTFEA